MADEKASAFGDIPDIDPVNDRIPILDLDQTGIAINKLVSPAALVASVSKAALPTFAFATSGPSDGQFYPNSGSIVSTTQITFASRDLSGAQASNALANLPPGSLIILTGPDGLPAYLPVVSVSGTAGSPITFFVSNPQSGGGAWLSPGNAYSLSVWPAAITTNGVLKADGSGNVSGAVAADIFTALGVTQDAPGLILFFGLFGVSSFTQLLSIFGITPVGDGSYNTGFGTFQNGVLTTQSGIPTSIEQAA